MKTNLLLLCLTLSVCLAACSGQSAYHKTPLPDPKSYNAHFGDMDTNGDDRIDWDEFRGRFPQTEPLVFNTIDLNADSTLDHDEWHSFKSAHGLKHHD